MAQPPYSFEEANRQMWRWLTANGTTDPAAISPTMAASVSVTTGTAPIVSFTAQSALNTFGTALDNTIARSQHSLFVVTGALVSAGVVTLQGSNDGTNFYSTAGTVTTVAASTAYAVAVANFPFRYIRAAITTLLVGGTCTAYVASAP